MNKNKYLTIIEHIRLLRLSLIKIIIVIILVTLLIMFNKSILFDYIIFSPAKSSFISYRFFIYISNYLSFSDTHKSIIIKDLHIQNRNIFGQFNSYLACSLFTGIVFSSPYVFYELWNFIKLGLSTNEKFVLKKIFFLSFCLFIMGLLFGYYILFPVIIQFSSSFTISDFPENIFDLCDYLSMMFQSVFIMGFVFLFPILIYFLITNNIISIFFLKKYRKHVFMLLLILSAAITPTDILSTIITFLPLYFLYELTIIFIYYFI